MPILAMEADLWLGVNLIARGFAPMTGSDVGIVAGEVAKFLTAAHQTRYCAGRQGAFAA
jgi:hypothetical protein